MRGEVWRRRGEEVGGYEETRGRCGGGEQERRRGVDG